LALLGTNLTDKVLHQIAEQEYKHIYVWLDPDSAGIKGAFNIVDQLKMYLTTAIEVTNLGIKYEAKTCTREKIMSLSKAYFNPIST